MIARRLRGDRRGVSFLEFGLILPVFLGFTLTGIEFGNFIMAANRVQRMAAMSSDLVAQSGSGEIGVTEAQVYDLFNALDLSAKPYDLRNHGRIVITGVQGTDNDNDTRIENRILWQRFDGGYATMAPRVGCNQTTALATLPEGRTLNLDEVMFHVQISYDYQPVFSSMPFRMANVEPAITRVSMFRARSKEFITPTPDGRFPPKKKCTSANGL